MKKFFPIKRSIRNKFIVFYIITSFLYSGVMYSILYATYHQAMIKQTETTCHYFLGFASYNISAFINETISLSEAITNNINIISAVRNLDVRPELENEVSDLLKKYLDKNTKVKSLRIYTDKTAVFKSRIKEELYEDNIRNTEFFKQADKKEIVSYPTYYQKYKSNYWGEKEIISYLYPQNIMSFVRVIRTADNQKAGTLVIDVEESVFSTLIDNVSLPKGNFFIVSTNDGQIISSSLKTLINKNLYTKDTLNIDKEDNNITKRIEGVRHLVTQKDFSYQDWKLTVCIPLNEIFLENKVLNRIIFSFLICFFIFSIVLGLIMTNVFTKPVKKLLSAIHKVKSGNFSSRINIISSDEIGDVGNRFNDMLDSLEKLLHENYEIKIKEKEAYIKSLESQINPHFLYNTLATIGWKVYLLGGNDISKIINGLSQMLRYSINQKIKFVTLEEDIEQVKNYVFIQETRYADRFKVYFKLQKESLNLKIHKLLIQPIVENAIVHGFEEIESGGVLCITSRIKNDSLYIEVFDNGKGISADQLKSIITNQMIQTEKDSKTHIGINNVHNRIRFYHGEKYGITIRSKINIYTKVILHLPADKQSS